MVKSIKPNENSLRLPNPTSVAEPNGSDLLDVGYFFFLQSARKDRSRL